MYIYIFPWIFVTFVKVFVLKEFFKHLGGKDHETSRKDKDGILQDT